MTTVSDTEVVVYLAHIQRLHRTLETLAAQLRRDTDPMDGSVIAARLDEIVHRSTRTLK